MIKLKRKNNCRNFKIDFVLKFVYLVFCSAIKQEDIPDVKKLKTESEVSGLTEEQVKKYEEHTKLLFKYRDQLKDLKKSELEELLLVNDQKVPSGADTVSVANIQPLFNV